MDKIEITQMTGNDTQYAYELTEKEKWGYLREDIDRLIEWEPEGCFVARLSGKRVGIITSTSYKDFAFIGTLIVEHDFRGKGIGELLTKTAINYLENKSVSTIELDGVIPAVSLYRRLGFVDKYLSLRFKRKPEKKSGNESLDSVNSIDKIIKLDSKLTALDRSRMIKYYFNNMPNVIVSEPVEDIDSYAMIRPRGDGFRAIGPIVSESHSTAEFLLEKIISVFGDRPLEMGVPAINLKAVDIAVKLGFKYSQPSLRMYRGPKRDYEKYIYAIFSAEKG
jgi:ribosomal protein S18 acetylase RimI-like enzyme